MVSVYDMRKTIATQLDEALRVVEPEGKRARSTSSVVVLSDMHTTEFAELPNAELPAWHRLARLPWISTCQGMGDLHQGKPSAIRAHAAPQLLGAPSQ